MTDEQLRNEYDLRKKREGEHREQIHARMTAFEDALASLGRKNWTACNLLRGGTDWYPGGQKEFEDHLKTCPLKGEYEDLWQTASTVNSEWQSIDKQVKDILMRLLMEGKISLKVEDV